MKNVSKTIVTLVLMFSITILFAQKSDEKGVIMTLEMKPVLQLDMETPQQIDFVFDSKKKFYTGIQKNGVTKLKVTATTKWDLYAVGRSTGKSPNGKTFWDQQVSYGSTVNSIADLPLSLLEIKQHQKNSGAAASKGSYADYSQRFANAFRSSAGNSLYVAENGTPTPPTKLGKYIAGHSGIAGKKPNDFMPSGTYANASTGKHFEYIIDYRILPGYPAIFPNAYNEDASIAQNIVAAAEANSVLAGGVANTAKKSYAEPGVYTMYVQYVLVEDQ